MDEATPPMDETTARQVLSDHWPVIQAGADVRCSCNKAWPCARRLAAERFADPVIVPKSWPWARANLK